MQLTDAAVENYFEGNNMTLAEKYNPYTDTREGTGSVWVYTSCIEAVNAVIDGLKTLRNRGDATLYDQHYSRYAELLDKLYLNAGFYRGTFTLTSYTQTKEWTVYAVNRSSGDMGTADVSGIMNVYDDQMWLIRELLNAYRLTGDEKFLTDPRYKRRADELRKHCGYRIIEHLQRGIITGLHKATCLRQVRQMILR